MLRVSCNQIITHIFGSSVIKLVPPPGFLVRRMPTYTTGLKIRSIKGWMKHYKVNGHLVQWGRQKSTSYKYIYILYMQPVHGCMAADSNCHSDSLHTSKHASNSQQKWAPCQNVMAFLGRKHPRLKSMARAGGFQTIPMKSNATYPWPRQAFRLENISCELIWNENKLLQVYLYTTHE